ncbi:Tyrosine-protein kinase [Parasponia andersonii]|uniref:Tyrosine-protein kinase n=1 Tax=Parasponia andersonii TaxID=3476 RepID=A0A2P5D2P7_PARAD|nr:Tyrosine-protein kinase [Parasponia andersonii]
MEASGSRLVKKAKQVRKIVGLLLIGQSGLSELALVYEYAENGFLKERGGAGFGENSLSLSWKMRLNVAKDIANAIMYLHTAFPRPIIHMKVQPSSLFLDKDIPRLCNFSDSLTIPEGQMHARVELYDNPEYSHTLLTVPIHKHKGRATQGQVGAIAPFGLL